MQKENCRKEWCERYKQVVANEPVTKDTVEDFIQAEKDRSYAEGRQESYRSAIPADLMKMAHDMAFEEGKRTAFDAVLKALIKITWDSLGDPYNKGFFDGVKRCKTEIDALKDLTPDEKACTCASFFTVRGKHKPGCAAYEKI